MVRPPQWRVAPGRGGRRFDVFITDDASIEFQQNVKRIGIAVIAIVGFRNRIEDLRPLLPRISAALTTIKPGQVLTITR